MSSSLRDCKSMPPARWTIALSSFVGASETQKKNDDDAFSKLTLACLENRRKVEAFRSITDLRNGAYRLYHSRKESIAANQKATSSTRSHPAVTCLACFFARYQ